MAMLAVLGGLVSEAIVLAGLRSALKGKKSKVDVVNFH
jgi:hypothetical protein